jgi:cytoskeletal protein CcmA (bactofilin family)
MWPRAKKKWDSSSEQTFTFLGKGAKFKGTLTYEGTLRIDGRLEGEIQTKGTVIVGEEAVIEGDITADAIISSGKITGNIVASEKVQLLAPGALIGTIKTPLLSLEEGVRFSGTCEAEGHGEVRTLDEIREGTTQGAARARGGG